MRCLAASSSFLLCSLPALLPAPLPSQQAPPAASASGAERTLRLGVVQWLRGNREEEEAIVPPVYSNHLPKTLTYETLVVVDDSGAVRPGLAQSWQRDADGRRYVFRLRPHATFHDGSACDAAAVERYFASWLVRDLDRFIGTCERIRELEVLDAHTLAIHLREPHAILADLALMNPMGIVGGRITPPHYPMIGSGPWRVTAFEPMRRMRFERHDRYDGVRPQLAAFEWITLIAGADRDPISTWSLERGHVDAVVESWRPSIPRDLARELVAANKARLVQGPGAMVQLLCFNHESGAFAQRAWRRVVRDAVDRDALVRVVEAGFARPCTALFAPAIGDWPDQAAVIDPPADAAATCAAPATATAAATVLVMSTDPAQLVLAVELANQLRPHGIALRIDNVTPAEHGRRVRSGEFDLYVTRTWGTPYDPQATLHARFRAETSQQRSVFFADPELAPLIDAAASLEACPERTSIYARVQRLLDERIAVIPLYVPDRIALLGPDVDGIELGDVVYGIDLSRLRWRR